MSRLRRCGHDGADGAGNGVAGSMPLLTELIHHRDSVLQRCHACGAGVAAMTAHAECRPTTAGFDIGKCCAMVGVPVKGGRAPSHMKTASSSQKTGVRMGAARSEQAPGRRPALRRCEESHDFGIVMLLRLALRVQSLRPKAASSGVPARYVHILAAVLATGRSPMCA